MANNLLWLYHVICGREGRKQSPNVGDTVEDLDCHEKALRVLFRSQW